MKDNIPKYQEKVSKIDIISTPDRLMLDYYNSIIILKAYELNNVLLVMMVTKGFNI